MSVNSALCSASFVQPCQPTLTREPPTGALWQHEVKFDGYRLQLHKRGRDVTLYSKGGNDFTSRFADVARTAADLPIRSAVFDCELTACAFDGSQDFSALLHRRPAPMCVWVFDLLYAEDKDLRPLPLGKRREKLAKLMAKSDLPSIQYSQTFDDPHRLLEACTLHKLEGIVSKRVDRPYRSGPSKDWLKTKCQAWREANRWRHEFFGRR